MPKYRKKPVVVEAVQWTGDLQPQIRDFIGEDFTGIHMVMDGGRLYIAAREGIISVFKGEYIIKDENGDVYPCEPDIFEKTYERVEEDG